MNNIVMDSGKKLNLESSKKKKTLREHFMNLIEQYFNTAFRKMIFAVFLISFFSIIQYCFLLILNII